MTLGLPGALYSEAAKPSQKPDFNEPIAKYDLSKEALSRVSLQNSGIAFAP